MTLPFATALLMTAAGGGGGGSFGGSGTTISAALGYLTADVTQNWGSEQVLSFGGESYDTDAWHDGAGAHPERFTVPSGVNYVECLVQVKSSNTGWNRLKIYKNGTHSDLYGHLLRQEIVAPIIQLRSPRIPVSPGDYLHATLQMDTTSSRIAYTNTFMAIKGYA